MAYPLQIKDKHVRLKVAGKRSDSQIQVALSIETETHVRLLNHTTINAVQDWPVADL